MSADPDEAVRALARTRSYTGWAIGLSAITLACLLLTSLFSPLILLAPFLATLAVQRDASRMEALAGERLPGHGALRILRGVTGVLAVVAVLYPVVTVLTRA